MIEAAPAVNDYLLFLSENSKKGVWTRDEAAAAEMMKHDVELCAFISLFEFAAPLLASQSPRLSPIRQDPLVSRSLSHPIAAPSWSTGRSRMSSAPLRLSIELLHTLI